MRYNGTMDELSDRRPIAARDLRPVIWLADRLVGFGASPHGVSVLGMVAGLLAGCAFAASRSWPGPLLWVLGAILVQTRLMANLLDGMVAIGRGVASPVGELFNEIPDRVSDTAILVGLGWATDAPALGVAAALAAMGTAYVRAVGRGLGRPSDFCGPMAKQHRMAVVTAASVVMAAAAVWHFETGVFLTVILCVITLLSCLTAGRRLRRIAAALGA